MRTVGIAVEGKEVVPVERDVDPDVFTTTDGVPDVLIVRGVLRLELNADSNWEGHLATLTPQPRR
jgi:hypothetical protein